MKEYPADLAKMKLIEMMKPEYYRYIETRLAGDFACSLVGVIEALEAENAELRERVGELEEKLDEAINLLSRAAPLAWIHNESLGDARGYEKRVEAFINHSTLDVEKGEEG